MLLGESPHTLVGAHDPVRTQAGIPDASVVFQQEGPLVLKEFVHLLEWRPKWRRRDCWGHQGEGKGQVEAATVGTDLGPQGISETLGLAGTWLYCSQVARVPLGISTSLDAGTPRLPTPALQD